MRPGTTEFYSGYKNNETPRFVTVSGRRLRVVEVISRRRMAEAKTRETVEVFQCLLEDGRTISLKTPII